jgi:hypothetical protein
MSIDKITKVHDAYIGFNYRLRYTVEYSNCKQLYDVSRDQLKEHITNDTLIRVRDVSDVRFLIRSQMVRSVQLVYSTGGRRFYSYTSDDVPFPEFVSLGGYVNSSVKIEKNTCI